ncbi:hypothetical protein R5H30_16370 [Sulfitobacter sp. D35]|nr:hypothetical protein [Sulfitobacter sp. D35]MDW4499570.1 hypothetical protein [Sulfitobacter sp. D35]
MSKKMVLLAAFGFVTFAAACAQQEEEVVIVPEPVTVEPTYTGKL